ncbi:histidine phosphatase family protein [Lysobacter sp. CA199]|uniref:histidine phosphatase family protein n=1 Tax=Lysobacter sp. CA199 TaxID=3455608 RepID=UPI003F8D7498
MATTIHLIRHGQAAFGAADYDQLSALGREQSRLLGAALAPLAGEGDIAICGGMRRHRQTAEECLAAMARAQGATPDRAAHSPSLASGRGVGVRDGQTAADPSSTLRINPCWNEFDHAHIIARHAPDYADHEHLVAHLSVQPDPRRAFQTLFAAAMTRWCDGRYDSDYDETWPAFQTRCMAAAHAAAEAAGESGNIWVFTSGGPIAAVVQHLLQVSDAQALRLSWTLVNASLTQLHVARGGLRLSTFNGHAHLYEREGLITHR